MHVLYFAYAKEAGPIALFYNSSFYRVSEFVQVNALTYMTVCITAFIQRYTQSAVQQGT